MGGTSCRRAEEDQNVLPMFKIEAEDGWYFLSASGRRPECFARCLRLKRKMGGTSCRRVEEDQNVLSMFKIEAEDDWTILAMLKIGAETWLELLPARSL